MTSKTLWLSACIAGLLMLWASPVTADEKNPVDRARYERAAGLIAEKNFVEARAVARLLVATNPKWVNAWIIFGMAHIDGTDLGYDIGEEAFEHASKLEPKNPQPWVSLAGLATAQKDTDDGATFILKAAELDPSDVKLQIQAARTLVAAKRMEEAKQRYDIVLETEPDNLGAVTGYGAMLTEMGEYAAAIKIYRDALAGGQKNILVYTNLCVALNKAAKYEETIEVANESLAKSEDQYILLHKARALSRLGRHAEAVEINKKLVARGSMGGQTAFAYYDLGIAQGLRGCARDQIPMCYADGANKPECCAYQQEALDAFTKVVEIDPEFKDAPIRLGLAQFSMGKLEDAEATLKNYVDEKGDRVPAEAFGALAVTLYRFDEERDIKDAVRMYREARELAPDFDSNDRMEKMRWWPPYAIEILDELRALADKPRETGGSADAGGCGCAVAGGSGTSSGTPLALASLLFLCVAIGRRRA